MILKSLYNVKVLWESATKFEKNTHSDLRFTFQILWHLQKNLGFKRQNSTSRFHLAHFEFKNPVNATYIIMFWAQWPYKNTADCSIFDPVDKLFDTFDSFYSMYIRGFTKFDIKVLCRLQFLQYLRTLSLKFQKARTKIGDFLGLPS